MNTVTVKKDDLIATVSKNRDEHRAIFLAAQDRYREKVIELLDSRLRQVRDGRPIDRSFTLPEPVDYTAEYDAALQMLTWEVNDEVTLDQDSFRQLVLNQWHWARNFAANTSSYLVE